MLHNSFHKDTKSRKVAYARLVALHFQENDLISFPRSFLLSCFFMPNNECEGRCQVSKPGQPC